MSRTILALSVVGAFVAGCGGGSSSPKSPPHPTGKRTPAAAQVAQRYLDSYTNHNANPICSSLLGSEVIAQMQGVKGCLKQVKASFKVGTFPKLHVRTALANGDTATAILRDSPRQITLTREGGKWKVTNGGT